jgi:methyl-accepting chemotaxis protein
MPSPMTSIPLAQAWRNGSIPLLDDLSIRLRFALLAALAALAVLTFAVTYAFGSARIDSALASQDGYRRLNDLAGDVEARALALQVDAEQYLRERDLRFVTAFRADIAQETATLAAMAAVPEAAPQMEAITRLDEGFRQLAGEFDRLDAGVRKLGLGEGDGLRGRLRASVKIVEDELAMWPNSPSLMVSMLQLRQAEKDFMLYGAESALGRHTKAAGQFDVALYSSALPPSVREDFRRLLGIYSEDMKAFGEQTVELAGEVDRLRRRQQGLRPEAAALFAFARAGMAKAIEDQETVRAASLHQTVMFGLLTVASLALAGMVVAISIIRPLRGIEGAMKALAAGDHTIEIPGIERRNEIGDMAKAVAVFKRNAEAVVRMQSEREQVRSEAEATSRRRMLTLAERFETAVADVADMVSTTAVTIHETAGEMAAGSRGNGSHDWSLTVVEAAEQARRTVAAVTDATRQLAVSVTTIAGHGAQVAEVVGTAVNDLGAAEDRVRGLAETAARIDSIVGLISDIAQRTNMLSLNATIEAQRAGSAGKGFAVVAGEVKRLAQQTAESTREIADQIAAIQASTTDTVEAISGIGGSIRRMEELARLVLRAVDHQAEVTRNIEACVRDVTAETHVLSDGVTAVTQSAAVQYGSATRVLWAAEDLAAPTRTLKHEVDGFLTTVREGAAA